MVLPCFDEEDDGVPPICLKSNNCPFNRNNPLLAQNQYVLMFGNIGWPYFDKHRRLYQGIAFMWTLVGFLFTIWGMLAVFNNVDLIRISYWAGGYSYTTFRPPKDEDYAEIWIGLRAYYHTSCRYDNVTSDHECETVLEEWDLGDSPEWAGTCAQACLDTWFGAVTSCVPMIFAMIGAMNRMRFASDAPQQKILGCITDTFGAISLAATMLNFRWACFEAMSREPFQEEGFNGQTYSWYWYRGAGYWIYWCFCFSGGIVRACIHWATPLPGMGVGLFTFIIPKQGFDQLDKFGAGAKAAVGLAVAATVSAAHKGVDATIAGAQLVAGGAAAGAHLTEQAGRLGLEKGLLAAHQGVSATKFAGETIAKGADFIDPHAGQALRAVGGGFVKGSELVVGAGVKGTGMVVGAGMKGTQLAVGGAVAGTQLAVHSAVTGSQIAVNGAVAGRDFVTKSAASAGESVKNLTSLSGSAITGSVRRISGRQSSSKVLPGTDTEELGLAAEVGSGMEAGDSGGVDSNSAGAQAMNGGSKQD
jgi:hypothetical protein